MGDHRLAHRPDRAGQRVEQLAAADADAVVVGREALGDQVGVGELVALAPADRLEADRERGQAALALLGQQADDQARVQAAGEQDPHGHVGDHAPPDGVAQGLEHELRCHSSGERPASWARRANGGSQ